MNTDELQEFIADNVYANVDPKIIGQMMSDSKSMDLKAFTDKWDEFLQENSSGWYKVRPQEKNLYERIREAYGSSDKKNPFRVSENYSDEIYDEKFADVPKEEYVNALKGMADNWDTEIKRREYETGRYKREQEVKKGGPKWWLASEYSKNRYINEPEKSLYSDEGEWYNKGDDVRDIMLGGAGLVGDFIPGWGAILGPAARGVRDWQNYGTPYEKDPWDIAKERGVDLATYGAAAFLPNFRRGKRIFNELGREVPGVGNVIKTTELTNDIGETLTILDALSNPYRKGAPTFADVTTRINRMPESPAKATLQKKLNEFTDVGNPEALEKFYNDIARTAKAEMFKFHNYSGIGAKDGNLFVKPLKLEAENIPEIQIKELMDSGLSREEAIKVLQRENEKLGKKVAESYQPLRQRVAETKPLGTVGKFMRDVALPVENKVEQGLAKQASRLVESDIADKDRTLKDWYKKEYARDWSMSNAFKPNEKPGDPLWEAWKEWDEERRREK
jgi:hypothetical protein